MRQWLIRVREYAVGFWQRSSLTVRILIAGLGLLLVSLLGWVFSGQIVPQKVPLLRVAIQDVAALEAIQLRLDQSGTDYVVREGVIYLESQEQARRMRDVLIREDLLPTGVDPWAIFDMERWTITDFERNVNLQRAITRKIELHIRALDDVDAVQLNLVVPKVELFREQQAQPSASVTLIAKPGSDLYTNKNKIQGIQKLIQYAVQGLDMENIVITDHQGRQINDFVQGSLDERLRQAQEQLKFKAQVERHYKQAIEQQLVSMYGSDRIKIINLDVNLDMSQKTTKAKEIRPIVLKERTPGLPYDDSQVISSITIEEKNESIRYRGAGMIPEGPLGVESQIAPAYQEVQELAGEYDKEHSIKHYVTNQVDTIQEGSPWEIRSIHIGVAVDGRWQLERDAQGSYVLDIETASLKREYIPVEDTTLKSIEEVIRSSVAFDPVRGDTISVQHIPFDRTFDHFQMDEAYYRSIKIQRFVYYMLWVTTGALFGSVILYFLWPYYRAFLKRRQQRRRELEEATEAAKQSPSIYSEEEKTVLNKIVQMAKSNPKELAEALRNFTER